MITGFEVGALFRLVDEMSPGLRKILESVRELNKAITGVRENLAGFSGAVAPGIVGATAETNSLAAAWDRVAASAAAARASIAASSVSAARSGAAAAVGGGGGFRPGVGGAAGYLPYVTGPGVPLPGGSHMRLSGTPAMVGAGVAAYSMYEAMNMQDATWWLNYHARRKATEKNNDQFKKIIEDAMKDTGLPLKDVAEAATHEVRMFQATPGVDPIGALPKLLRAAAFESKAKPGTTVQEAMRSIVGMAHMVGAYSPEEIDKLLPKFAYLSIANPQSLNSMERAFSYSVPVLQSGADVDPFGTMTLGTALATSGVTNTKSGTWVREMVKRSMPGDDKHNAALKRLGLIDDEGKPTWFTGGKPDPMKLLEIAGPKAADIPVAERIGAEHEVFGTQGSGAFSVLAAPKVLDRARELRQGMEGSKDQYDMALEGYRGTTKQEARSALQGFNIAMIELGEKALPLATWGLKGFSGALHGLNIIQGAAPKGPHGLGLPMQREAIPRAWNWMFGPKETDGALKPQNQSFPGGALTPQPMNFLQGPPTTPKVTPISLSLNVDGRTLAQAVSEVLEDLTEHATGSPNYNAQSHFGRADGGLTGT
jgi:hypothetical protein